VNLLTTSYSESDLECGNSSDYHPWGVLSLLTATMLLGSLIMTLLLGEAATGLINALFIHVDQRSVDTLYGLTHH
jgi:hypothetical protein